MPLDSTNLFLSLAILQNQGVARDKMFAASVGAALIPGLMGLVIPLVVARTDDSSPSGTGTDTGTLTAVPLVLGKTQAEAEKSLTNSGLTPVVQTSFFLPSTTKTGTGTTVGAIGTVVDQNPPEKVLVTIGTEVTITVSLGAPPSGPPDDTAIDQQIQMDVEKLKVDILDTQNQIKVSKEQILAAIAANAPKTKS